MKIKFGIAVLLPFSILVSTATAEKAYKYTDENGVLHFSDRMPNTRQPVEVEQVRVSDHAPRLSVDKRGSRRKPIVHVYNGYGGPIEFKLELTESNNIISTPPLPLKLIVPSFKEVDAVTIQPKKNNSPWSYTYRYRSTIGSPDARHKPLKPYSPPFENDKSFKISQAFKGEFSHKYPSSEYAVDISMPEGTPIHVARSGVVMDIANDFFKGGNDLDKYGRRANLVRILHDDGTMAVYAHLKLESVRFGIGMRIKEGEFIAESGNTGFSTGPHLHFVIQKNAGMKLESVPFLFANKEGKGIIPQKGLMLGESMVGGPVGKAPKW